eukprot:3136134-Rhodomonas_salina.2
MGWKLVPADHFAIGPERVLCQATPNVIVLFDESARTSRRLWQCVLCRCHARFARRPVVVDGWCGRKSPITRGPRLNKQASSSGCGPSGPALKNGTRMGQGKYPHRSSHGAGKNMSRQRPKMGKHHSCLSGIKNASSPEQREAHYV